MEANLFTHPCLTCSSPARFLFETRDCARSDSQEKYQVFWCDRCQLGRLGGVFSPQDVSTFYPPDYYTHDTSRNSRQEDPSFASRLRTHIAWRIDKGAHFSPAEVSGRTVLDIGCGSGD